MPRKRRRLGWDELEEELFGSESDSEDEMYVHLYTIFNLTFLGRCRKKVKQFHLVVNIVEPEKHEQHPHPLVEMPNPYGEYCTECDVCGNQITDTIFHCEDCKWDACPLLLCQILSNDNFDSPTREQSRPKAFHRKSGHNPAVNNTHVSVSVQIFVAS